MTNPVEIRVWIKGSVAAGTFGHIDTYAAANGFGITETADCFSVTWSNGLHGLVFGRDEVLSVKYEGA